jgi:hypothetical protein
VSGCGHFVAEYNIKINTSLESPRMSGGGVRVERRQHQSAKSSRLVKLAAAGPLSLECHRREGAYFVFATVHLIVCSSIAGEREGGGESEPLTTLEE